MPNLTLCTAQDIKDRIGDALFLQLVDDDQSGSQSGTTEARIDTVCIRRASNRVEAKCERYDLSLADVSVYSTYVGLVRDWAADLAAFYLCGHRNLANAAAEPPGSVATDFERTEKELEEVRLSRLNIPGLVPRGRSAPTLSNMGVSQRGGIAVPVVQTATSPNKPTPDHTQFRDRSVRYPG